ncbi:hypothetical protein SUGI_0222620 [Cryptomeria japonica]|nr:hypothetical protein SUGI_0222620 [Cryptomeria japonica]
MQRHGMPNYLTFERQDPQQKIEECEMGLQLFSSPESNTFSIPTDNEDFIAESTEDGSYITTKSDTFSFIHENDIFSESQSAEDVNFVSRKDEEIDDFDRTTIGREALYIEQSLEMHNAEAKKGDDGNEAEENDSNANTWPEQSLILQGLRMDGGLTENILVPDQWNFWEPVEAIIEQKFSIPTTEVPENPSLPSSFGSFEVDYKALTFVREKEKVLKVHPRKRSSIWDCCGFWNWFQAHED